MKQMYILKRPIVTEKSLYVAGRGQYTFEVDRKARKEEIANVIEKAFNVHVINVKTINLKGKTRRFGPRRKPITASPFKKAIVQLKADEKIDLFEAGGEQKAKGA